MSLKRFISKIREVKQEKESNNRKVSGVQSELSQGRAFLSARRQIVYNLRSSSRLLEGFTVQDPAFASREHAISYSGSRYRGAISEIQRPVDLINEKEMVELKEQEEMFKETLNNWSTLHDSVINRMKALPLAYTECIDACSKREDLKDACKLGCMIKQYAVRGDDQSRELWINSGQYRLQPATDPETSSDGSKLTTIQAEIGRLKSPSSTRNDLQHAWTTLVEKGCYRAIEGTEPADRCKGWQSVQGKQSGFYTDAAPLQGELQRYNCNVTIAKDKAGYCVCKDGKKVGYADSGTERPAFNCNVLCDSSNNDARGVYTEQGHNRPNAPLYSNPSKWQKEVPCPVCRPMRWWDDASKQKELCERNEGCCKYTQGHRGWPWAWSRWWRTRVLGSKCNKVGSTYCPEGKRCVTAAEAARSPINNITGDNLKGLPTLEEDENACRIADYENMYLDLQKLRVLEQQLDERANAIYGKIKRNTDLSSRMAAYRTKSGKGLLDHLDIYKSIYRKYQTMSQGELNMKAMGEDGTARIGSVRISYTIWLILAISAMLLVIRHLRK